MPSTDRRSVEQDEAMRAPCKSLCAVVKDGTEGTSIGLATFDSLTLTLSSTVFVEPASAGGRNLALLEAAVIQRIWAEPGRPSPPVLPVGLSGSSPHTLAFPLGARLSDTEPVCGKVELIYLFLTLKQPRVSYLLHRRRHGLWFGTWAKMLSTCAVMRYKGSEDGASASDRFCYRELPSTSKILFYTSSRRATSQRPPRQTMSDVFGVRRRQPEGVQSLDTLRLRTLASPWRKLHAPA
ncbi:MutS-like protein [Perkinsus olseni]|uniref:MutS-like protein n=1 Tax=Perkinsus olseni TaxID=32597 RepID=A0A7J6T652_PEROL|nr:MutS-like protein [Perkinsus olseni]